jgi:serpin B
METPSGRGRLRLRRPKRGGLEVRSGRALAPVLLTALFACAAKPGPTHDTHASRGLASRARASVDSVVAAADRFALDLFARLADRPGNVFFSPFSVSTVLSMTAAGASSATLEQLRSTLHLTVAQQEVNRAYGALLASLDSGASAGDYDLETANRLWGQKGIAFLDGFASTMRDDYHAPLGVVDFAGAPENARAAINQWVEDATKGKIKELLEPGLPDPATRLVLANAIYFKGEWAARFDRNRTHERPFFVSGEREVSVPMMFRNGRYRVAKADGLRLLEVPYRGPDLAMIIILPDSKDGLLSAQDRLTQENLGAWLTELRAEETDVGIPRFHLETEYTLNAALADLGMRSAFDEDAADFSGMDGDRDLFLSLVVHKAYLDVNEEGTEAAAATAAVMMRSVSERAESFIADHPFIFLIRDNVTGAILFLGRLVDPAA